MVAGLIAIMCSNNIYNINNNNDDDNKCDDNKCDDCINCDDCDFEDIYEDDAYLNCKNYKSYDEYLDEE